MGISCAFYPEMVGLRIVYPVMWEFLNDFKTRGATALKEWESWWNDFPKKYSAAPHFFEIAGIAMAALAYPLKRISRLFVISMIVLFTDSVYVIVALGLGFLN